MTYFDYDPDSDIHMEDSLKKKDTAEARIIPFKKAPAEYSQRTMFPDSIFDLLPEDHECILYKALLDQIDVTSLHQNYSVLGQNAYNPKLLTIILIYAYSQGILSSRKIAEKMKIDIGFMYVGEMQLPNFRVISDFRKDNIEFFKNCFKQTVMLAMSAGLVRFGHISIDGTKFKADTSKHKAMSYGRMKAKEAELVKEIDDLVRKAEACDGEEDRTYKEKTGHEIPEDLRFKRSRLEKIRSAKEALEQREADAHPGEAIDDKKQISFADHDAVPINGNKGDFDYKYNAQVSVDSKSQIIIGAHVSLHSNDKQELEPAIQEAIATVGPLPKDVQLSVDNGYFSGKNLSAIEAHKIDAYIAVGQGEKEPAEGDKLKKEQFKYDVVSDSFTCPNEKQCELKSETSDGKKIYRAQKEDCDGCPLKAKCCSSKKGEPRSITTDCHEDLRQSMRDKMQSEQSKKIYGQRKTIVEPVFGQIKNAGFRRFSLRGIAKVSGEFSLICAVHNIKKITRATKTVRKAA